MSKQDQVKRCPGRPATYANASERAKAWRIRQKALIAQASKQEPVIIEKVVEKIIEKPVYVLPPKTARGNKSLAQASKLAPIIRERLTDYSGLERAKALRAKTAHAATTVSDLLDLLSTNWRGQGMDSTEKEFLEQVKAFFLSLTSDFKAAQHDAKEALTKHQQESHQQHEQRIRELVVKTFGNEPSLNTVIAIANDLQTFASNGEEWLVKKFGVDRGTTFYIGRSYELRDAIRTNNLKTIMRVVAEVRDEAGEQGKRLNYNNIWNFAAGWAEFEKWRDERKDVISIIPKPG